jgi:hypothetical protein
VNELEISLFGPGKGESCVIHLGQGDWIIVDSCRDQRSGSTVPLDYLTALGVDLATQVKLVVATHAHDDHIAGIAAVFEACEQAFFVCSAALSREEFAALLEVDVEAVADVKRRNYDQYRRVFDMITARGLTTGVSRRRLALESRILLHRPGTAQAPEAVVRSLSPSDEAVTITQRKLLEYLPTPDSGIRPPRVDPNELAIALWVQVGDQTALLGADLLTGPSGCGWGAVLASLTPDTHASVYKVAHHGSSNADHPGVWTDLLQTNPIALLAPYRAGVSPVPSDRDVARLCALTPWVYATANPSQPASPKAVRRAAASLGQLAKNVRDPWGTVGHVRARMTPGSTWQVQTASPALRLCS